MLLEQPARSRTGSIVSSEALLHSACRLWSVVDLVCPCDSALGRICVRLPASWPPLRAQLEPPMVTHKESVSRSADGCGGPRPRNANDLSTTSAPYRRPYRPPRSTPSPVFGWRSGETNLVTAFSLFSDEIAITFLFRRGSEELRNKVTSEAGLLTNDNQARETRQPSENSVPAGP